MTTHAYSETTCGTCGLTVGHLTEGSTILTLPHTVSCTENGKTATWDCPGSRYKQDAP